MAGLIGIGRNTLGQAAVGFQQTAGLEANRNAAAQQLEAARSAQRSSMVSTGAGLGASVGVNNLMAAAPTTLTAVAPAAAPAAVAPTAAVAGGVPMSTLGATSINGVPMIAANYGLETIALPAAEAITAGGSAAGAAGAGTAAGTAATTGTATAAGTTATAASGAGASAGALGAIGAVATPLLIGAGAALLLDSLFDIF